SFNRRAYCSQGGSGVDARTPTLVRARQPGFRTCLRRRVRQCLLISLLSVRRLTRLASISRETAGIRPLPRGDCVVQWSGRGGGRGRCSVRRSGNKDAKCGQGPGATPVGAGGRGSDVTPERRKTAHEDLRVPATQPEIREKLLQHEAGVTGFDPPVQAVEIVGDELFDHVLKRLPGFDV